MNIEALVSVVVPETQFSNDFPAVEIKPWVESVTFGTLIKNLRENANLTPRELASEMGVSHTTIYRIEKAEPQNVRISSAVALSNALCTNERQELVLIASLAKDEDRDYINNLLGLTGKGSNRNNIIGIDNTISLSDTPREKAIDYGKKRGIKGKGRSTRQIAAFGGLNHTLVSRFLSGKRVTMLGSTFVSFVRGLGLTSKEQVLDFFYSFGTQENAEEKAS